MANGRSSEAEGSGAHESLARFSARQDSSSTDVNSIN